MLSKTSRISPVVWILLAIAAVFGGIAATRVAGRLFTAGIGSPPPTMREAVAAIVPTGSWTPTRTDGGQYDWEKPSAIPRSQYVSPDFTSPRTLEQTTAFLTWAINRYGQDLHPAAETLISNVRFDGCVMQWKTMWYVGDFLHMNETDHKVHLRNLRAHQGAVLITDSSVRTSTAGNEVEQKNRFWKKEGGRMVERVPSHVNNGYDVLIPLQDQENIAVRVGYALTHAARLCGANTERR